MTAFDAPSNVIFSPSVEKATVVPSALTNVNVSSIADAVNATQVASEIMIYLIDFIVVTMDYMCFGEVEAHSSGDVNGDGEVNIADVNAIIDLILTGKTTPLADVNCDGEVNIADVNAVIDIILNN